MKTFLILSVMTMAICACHRKMSPWPYEGDKQMVTLQTRTDDNIGFSSLPANCRLFLFNAQNNTTTSHLATQDGSNNRYSTMLFPGEYTAYCITNASEDLYWDFEKNSSPEEIFLKSQTAGGGRDHLIGSAQIKVTNGAENHFIFDLERKVAQILIVIHNMPEWLQDLQVKINNIPRTLSLTGEYNTSTHTVTCPVSLPNNGISRTTLLVFPPQNNKQSTLTLSSEKHVYVSEEYIIGEIAANKITCIEITFTSSHDITLADFTTSTIEWDLDTIKEIWETPAPEQIFPCTGEGDGYNLVKNPGFEYNWEGNLPVEWNIESSKERDNYSTQTTEYVREGQYAIRINGSTYLYQDVPVTGGECYQLKMFVNAPHPEVKWRYWCTWMEGSTPLNNFSADLHPSSYRYQTDGYIDALEGNIFRAPANATKLRMQIRTYKGTPLIGEGLYIDGVYVEKVK